METLLMPRTFWQYVLFASIVLAVCITAVIVYRLTLHPLTKYPGPWLAAVTDWVIVYKTCTGNRHLDHVKEHERYGHIVRIGPNTLSFNTIAAVKEIYANRKGNVQKAPWYSIIEASAGEDSLHALVDRNMHAVRRRVVDQAFSERALRSAEPFLIQNVKTFRDVIAESVQPDGDGKGWSQAFNMSQWSIYLNYDIMGDLVFGRRFDCMTNEEHRFVPGLLMNASAFIYTFASIPIGRVLRTISTSGVLDLIGGQMAVDEKRFYKYAEDCLSERIAAEQKSSGTNDNARARKDMMHYLLNAIDPQTGKGLTRQQLNAESGLLIAAGADTTSTTLAAVFFYLLRNPGVLESLLSEIRRAFNSVDEISASPGSRLTSLPYLRAVIDETLRMSPPAPSHLPREVLRGGITVDGEYVPEGTIVGVAAYAIHRNPVYYPLPNEFCPERWIVDDAAADDASSPRTAEAVQTARHAFTAFSHGARGCVGRQLAYYELQTALAILLYQFDIRLAKDVKTGKIMKNSTGWREGVVSLLDVEDQKEDWREERKRRDEFQLFDHFLADRSGPMVEFKDRFGC